MSRGRAKGTPDPDKRRIASFGRIVRSTHVPIELLRESDVAKDGDFDDELDWLVRIVKLGLDEALAAPRKAIIVSQSAHATQRVR